jgi:group I intron endonuclease
MTDIKMGIYSIMNKVNGKRYVGSALNLDKRWKSHRRSLIRGAHHSRHLQRAWNKYGAENFVFEILSPVWDSQKLTKVEQLFLDIYISYDPRFGYNTCPAAGSMLGFFPQMNQKKKCAWRTSV